MAQIKPNVKENRISLSNANEKDITAALHCQKFSVMFSIEQDQKLHSPEPVHFTNSVELHWHALLMSVYSEQPGNRTNLEFRSLRALW